MELTIIGYILGFYWDNGEENGNYYNYIYTHVYWFDNWRLSSLPVEKLCRHSQYCNYCYCCCSQNSGSSFSVSAISH